MHPIRRCVPATLRFAAAALLAAASSSPYAAGYRWLNSQDRTQPHIPLLAEPFVRGIGADA